MWNVSGNAMFSEKCGQLTFAVLYAGCRPDDGYQSHSQYNNLELHFGLLEKSNLWTSKRKIAGSKAIQWFRNMLVTKTILLD
jgi:hypothetical protein